MYVKTHVHLCVCVYYISPPIAQNCDPNMHIADFESSDWCLRPVGQDYFRSHFPVDSFSNVDVDLTKPKSWREAMTKVQHFLKTEDLKHLKFHPLQSFHFIPECAAQGKKIIILLLHADGLETGHHLTRTENRGVVGVGFQLVNLKPHVKRHFFYVRTLITPKNDYWNDDHILQIVRKDLLCLRDPIPVALRDRPGKFEYIYPVLIGVIGDGPEVSRFLIKGGLGGYTGAHIVFDNLEESNERIGSPTQNVFIPRRWIKNWVCDSLLLELRIVNILQNITQLRNIMDYLDRLDGISNTRKNVYQRLCGGWQTSNAFVKDCQIIDDNTMTMDLSVKPMMANDTKFSPIFGGIRCTDHLKQNIIKLYYQHITKYFPKWFERGSDVCDTADKKLGSCGLLTVFCLKTDELSYYVQIIHRSYYQDQECF